MILLPWGCQWAPDLGPKSCEPHFCPSFLFQDSVEIRAEGGGGETRLGHESICHPGSEARGNNQGIGEPCLSDLQLSRLAFIVCVKGVRGDRFMKRSGQVKGKLHPWGPVFPQVHSSPVSKTGS